jgi:hypothetical protein
MKKQNILATSAAVSLILTSAVFAQTPPQDSVPAQKQCSGLTGAAYDSCLKSTPGRSGDAASRASERTPGKSDDAASRTGSPAGIVQDPGSRSNQPGGGNPNANPKK